MAPKEYANKRWQLVQHWRRTHINSSPHQYMQAYDFFST